MVSIGIASVLLRSFKSRLWRWKKKSDCIGNIFERSRQERPKIFSIIRGYGDVARVDSLLFSVTLVNADSQIALCRLPVQVVWETLWLCAPHIAFYRFQRQAVVQLACLGWKSTRWAAAHAIAPKGSTTTNVSSHPGLCIQRSHHLLYASATAYPRSSGVLGLHHLSRYFCASFPWS